MSTSLAAGSTVTMMRCYEIDRRRRRLFSAERYYTCHTTRQTNVVLREKFPGRYLSKLTSDFTPLDL